MGWLDKAKVALGILDPEDLEPSTAKKGPKGRDDRPPLDGIEVPNQQSLDDVLAAREAGDLEGMRQLLRDIDRGRGLRHVLRAAAALEAGDEAELKELLPSLKKQDAPWRLSLQLAAVLDDTERAAALRARAEQQGAPGWALSWAKAMSSDAAERRDGLVTLLFENAPLARTIAAKDLSIEGALADPDAARRYTAFAHGRDCVRRFGAAAVADLLDRVEAS